MLAASIDIGTNSSRLLIVDYDSKDDYKIIKRKLITTRLGQGVDKNKNLSDKAIKRTISAIKKFNREIRVCGVDRKYVKIAGTSALRDVGNADGLTGEIAEETGLKLQVVSGDKEAYLTYRGVNLDLSDTGNLIIDIGGGSTEFIWQSEEKVKFRSLNIGAVRMTERYISNPARMIPETELNFIQEEIKKILQNNLQEEITSERIIGTGGTITTLAAVDLSLKEYDYEKVHLYQIGIQRIKQIMYDLASKGIEKRSKVNGLQPERADIISAGIAILLSTMKFLHRTVLTVSEHDLLFGLIREIVKSEH